MDPDKRRDRDPEEGVRHFVDLDRYGRFPFSQFSLNYDALVNKFGKETVHKNGLVLWATEKSFNDLVDAFRQKNKQKILRHSTDLAHYVADLHQPFHAVENYNGQLTGQHGIHFRFEDDLLNLYIETIRFVPSRPTDLGAVLQALYSIALDSFSWADNILVADQKAVSSLGIARGKLPREKNRIIYPRSYYEFMFRELAPVLERRLNLGAQALASLWWMAWKQAGSPDF